MRLSKMMKTRTEMAKQLIKQIKDDSKLAPFWMLSALTKIADDSPEMSVTKLLQLLRDELPETAELYDNYILNT